MEDADLIALCAHLIAHHTWLVRRYEVNPDVVQQIEDAGMQFVGRDETGERMEILELVDNPSDHPYYVAAQYHPEYKSRWEWWWW
eukprot:scaffold88855_cov26-Tisochrysis_lutea.AAC.1